MGTFLEHGSGAGGADIGQFGPNFDDAWSKSPVSVGQPLAKSGANIGLTWSKLGKQRSRFAAGVRTFLQKCPGESGEASDTKVKLG